MWRLQHQSAALRRSTPARMENGLRVQPMGIFTRLLTTTQTLAAKHSRSKPTFPHTNIDGQSIKQPVAPITRLPTQSPSGSHRLSPPPPLPLSLPLSSSNSSSSSSTSQTPNHSNSELVFDKLPIEYFPRPVRATQPIISTWLRSRFRGRPIEAVSHDTGRFYLSPSRATHFLILECAMVMGSTYMPLSVIGLFHETTLTWEPESLVLVDIGAAVAKLLTYFGLIRLFSPQRPDLRILPLLPASPNNPSTALSPADAILRVWRRYSGAVGLVAGTALFLFFLQVNFGDGSVRNEFSQLNGLIESSRILEFGIDYENMRWMVGGWPISFGAPLLEELLFRGLICARISRMLGVPAGILISSVIFGVAHGDLKMSMATRAGFELSALFVLSQNLALPIMWHSTLNYNTTSCRAQHNPMKPFSVQCDRQQPLQSVDATHQEAREAKLEMLKQFETKLQSSLSPALTSSSSPSKAELTPSQKLNLEEMKKMRVRLTSDFQHLTPDLSLTIDGLFNYLDRDRKGYLSVEEWSWLSSIHPIQHQYLVVQTEIIARRASKQGLAQISQTKRQELWDGVKSRSLNLSCEIPILSFPPTLPAKSKSSPVDIPYHHMAIPLSWSVRYKPTTSPLDTSESFALVRNWFSLHHAFDYQDLFHGAILRTYKPIPKKKKSLNGQTLTNALRTSLPITRPTTNATTPTTPSPATAQPFSSFSREQPSILKWDGCTRQAFQQYWVQRFQLEPELTHMWLQNVIGIVKQPDTHPLAQFMKERTTKEFRSFP